MNSNRLEHAIRLIDEANARDPKTVEVDGEARPAELVYSERMTKSLATLSDDPSDHLQIAARAQHIERWTSPRKSYPEGKAGYMKWRNDLKQYHATRAGEIMREAGYDQDDVDRVATLIGKRGIKRDPEVQMLEDTVCVTFLEHYAGDFIEPYDDEKVIDILAKTARKMSPEGLAAAAGLPMPERLARLLTETLAASKES
jgi:hypothetical protein